MVGVPFAYLSQQMSRLPKSSLTVETSGNLKSPLQALGLFRLWDLYYQIKFLFTFFSHTFSFHLTFQYVWMHPASLEVIFLWFMVLVTAGQILYPNISMKAKTVKLKAIRAQFIYIYIYTNSKHLFVQILAERVTCKS